jgi:ubiquinone/menaquinone biosynthesis C-methylase UbiE/predicted transcriptional regulator
MAAAKKMSKLRSPEEIYEMISSFRMSRVILTAFELEIFSILENKSLTSKQIALRAKSDIRGIDRLLNALCALGLVTKKQGHFANTSLSRKYLVKDQPNFLAGLAHSVNTWKSWSTLTQAVIKGTTVIDRKKTGMDANRLPGFIAAMHERASSHADEVIKRLDLKNVRKTLDIGGGSGAYSTALVRVNKDIQATVFDLPDVIPLTQSYVNKSRFASRIDFIEGDFKRDSFKSGYDLILLSAIIHMNSYKENLSLSKKASRALNSGGQLVIQDFIMSEDRLRPEFGAFFALNMLVNTKDGDTYTKREVYTLMKQAGLTKISTIKTPFNTFLVVGKKI